MNEQDITLNESIQLHEIITFKNICLTKSITMSPLVSDDELKSILQQEVTTSQQHINELRDIMSKSDISSLEQVKS